MKLGLLLSAAVLVLALPGFAFARQSGWACWYQAAKRYHVDPALLYSVARVETKATSGVVARNSDGSYDIGVMQINSSWLPELAKYGITAATLRHNACVNVMIGAWILSQSVQQYGLNWKGVGAYNASTPWKRARYAAKVAHELRAVRTREYVAQEAE